MKMTTDPINLHLDLIARLLEAAGYAVEVNYSGATIVVWLDEWPVVVEIKTPPKSKRRKRKLKAKPD
jgi:hypothetical protein